VKRREFSELQNRSRVSHWDGVSLGHAQNRSMRHSRRIRGRRVCRCWDYKCSAAHISHRDATIRRRSGMRRFLKVMTSTRARTPCGALSSRKRRGSAQLYPTIWMQKCKYAKLLRVAKYARTLKSIMRPPLLFPKYQSSQENYALKKKKLRRWYSKKQMAKGIKYKLIKNSFCNIKKIFPIYNWILLFQWNKDKDKKIFLCFVSNKYKTDYYFCLFSYKLI